MVAGLYQTIAKMPRASGIAKDASINVWHFECGDSSAHSVVHADIAAKLLRWYNTDLGAAQTFTMAQLLSNAVKRTTNAASFTSYFTTDFDGSTPFGSPVAMSNWTVGGNPTGVVDLPSESAIVVGFHGDLTDVPQTAPNPTPPPAIIRPAARRRGRIYLGPLNVAAMTDNSSVNFDPVISTTVQSDVALISTDMAQANDVLSTWAVWSRPDAAVYPVVGGFTDNAFDVQRRRGPAATSRNTWLA